MSYYTYVAKCTAMIYDHYPDLAKFKSILFESLASHAFIQMKDRCVMQNNPST